MEGDVIKTNGETECATFNLKEIPVNFIKQDKIKLLLFHKSVLTDLKNNYLNKFTNCRVKFPLKQKKFIFIITDSFKKEIKRINNYKSRIEC